MTKLLTRFAIRLTIIALLFLALPQNFTVKAEGATRTRAQEQREFASFVDGFVAGVQKEQTIPGMVLAAVKDGEVLYLKGYGFANVSARTPADPEKTLFRVGAISQPITVAAIMQLAERGRIILDDDVNIYLRRWRLPDTFEQPITIRNMMTHTAGFDFKELEIAAPTSADERDYPTRLPKMMPRRVNAPGIFYRESSMGYALLGSIVERYTRLDFDAAIKRHIFTPLGMTESAFTLQSDELSRLATGYDPSGEPVAYEYRYDLPAIGMSTTAHDMGRFILAQLSGGGIGRNRILGELHSGSMMNRHFSPHPLINGVCLGYLERPISGLRTVQQYGNIPGYSSFLMIIPEQNFGLFLAANASDVNFSEELSVSLVERFFPRDTPRTRAQPQIANVSPDIEGSYRTNKISHLTAEKITKFFESQINITINQGSIIASSTSNPSRQTLWFATSAADLFRKVENDGYYENEYMFFQRDERGAIAALIMGGVNNTFERLETYETLRWQWKIVSGFIAAALFSFIGLYIGYAFNKSRFPWEKGYTSDTELWGISSLFWLLQLIFIGGLLIASMRIGHEFKIFVPYQVKALFVIPLACGLLLTWFWFRTFTKLFSPDHYWLEKILILCLASAATAYMFCLAHWRMLGFMF